jgi:hypothetical protein
MPMPVDVHEALSSGALSENTQHIINTIKRWNPNCNTFVVGKNNKIKNKEPHL